MIKVQCMYVLLMNIPLFTSRIPHGENMKYSKRFPGNEAAMEVDRFCTILYNRIWLPRNQTEKTDNWLKLQDISILCSPNECSSTHHSFHIHFFAGPDSCSVVSLSP
jgi:hypothetical protein